MNILEIPHKTVRLGVTADASMVCVGFAPILCAQELARLPQPYTAKYGETEAFGWPHLNILSSVPTEEMVIVALKKTIESDMLRATPLQSQQEEIESDPHAAYKYLARYASTVARHFHRQLVPVWYEAVQTPDGNGLVISQTAKSRQLP
jgi:hypothetical protein